MPNDTMTFGVDLIPSETNQYNLGDATHQWKINGVTPVLTDTDEKVKSSPATTTLTYYLVGSTASGTVTEELRKHEAIKGYTTADKDTGGSARITLGNSISTTAAGGKEGILRLYGTTTYYVDLKAGAPSSNRTITFPNKTGTVALTSDISTKIDTAGAGLIKNGTTISIESGKVTNEMLAGSIANEKLVNSSLTVGNKTISLGTTGTIHDILYSSTNIGATTSWDITDPGVYYVASSSEFTGNNAPETANGGLEPYRYGQLIVSRANNGGIAEFYISHRDSTSDQYGIKYRTGWNNEYTISGESTKWATILDSGNYTQYTVTKSGSGASGTWDISISGTAEQAIKDSNGLNIANSYVKLAGTNTISATNTFSSNNTFTGNIIANGLVSLIKTSTTPVANFIYFQNNAVVSNTLMQVGVSGDNKYQGILSKGYYNGTAYTSSEQWVIARASDGSIITGGNTKINGALTISGNVVANGLVSLIKTSTTSVANFIYFQSNAVVTSTLMQIGISGDSKYQGILSKGYYNGTTYTASEQWVIARKGDGAIITGGNLLPITTKSCTLGSNDYKWKQIFIENTSGGNGEITISRENNGSFVIGYESGNTNAGLWDTRLNNGDGGWLIYTNGTSVNLGTIASGVWNGSIIDIAHGGTNASSAAGAKNNLGLGSSTADIQIGNYNGVNQFFGISGVVEASSQGDKPFLNKRVAMIFKQDGLFMYNSDDQKSIWGFTMDASSVTMNLCQTPQETSPGTEKLSIKLVYKDNNTSGVGGMTQPVYVDSNGKVRLCCSGNTVWPSLTFSSYAFNDGSYKMETTNTWGTIYTQVPGMRISNSARLGCSMSFRVWSHNNAGTRSSYYDTYTLPVTQPNATANHDYYIYTTNNVLYNANTPTVRANGSSLRTGDIWFKPL